MTLFGIDISHHQAGINLQRVKDEGFKFIIARVGQGRGGAYGTTKDREWIRHRNETRRVGLKLCAYWYIGNGISAAENVRLCREWMGDDSISVALDCEAGSGNIGFYREVLAEFQKAKIKVPLSYIPKWYWQSIGSSNLAGLPPLWSSRYVNGGGTATQLYPGDNSNHWTGYGNNSIVMAQFTSSARVAGYTVDANAFKGTEEQLGYLFTGSFNPPAPQPVPVPTPPVEVDMQLDDVVGTKPDGSSFTVRDVFKKEFFTDLSKLDKAYDLLVQIHHDLPEELQNSLRDKFNALSELIYILQGKDTWEDVQEENLTWEDLEQQQWGEVDVIS